MLTTKGGTAGQLPLQSRHLLHCILVPVWLQKLEACCVVASSKRNGAARPRCKLWWALTSYKPR